MNRRGRHARWPLLVGLLLLLALIPFALYHGSQVPDAEAAWWNESWQYRKRIDITNPNSSDLTDFQVSFTLDTASLISAGKLQSQCQDIRITDVGGKELPFWVETGPTGCGTNQTVVWTKVFSLPRSGAALFFYYGNPSATEIANGNAVFDHWDLTTFTEVDPNNHLSVTSSSEISTNNLSSNEDAYVYKQITARNTGTIDAVVKRTAGASKVTGIGVSNNQLNDCHGFSDGACLIWRWGISFKGLINGNTQTSDIATILDNTYYYVSIDFTGTNTVFRVYGDAARTTLLGSQTSTWASSFNYLYAVSSYNDGSGATINDTISNFHLRKYASTQPTTSLASEETGSGPVAYWKFDEGSGSVVYDSATYSMSNELLADGDMEAADTSDWTAATSTLSKETSDPYSGSNSLRVSNSAAPTHAWARQTIVSTGKRYRVSGYAKSDGVNTPLVYSGGVRWTGTPATSWQAFDVEYTMPAGTTISFGAYNMTTGGYVEFDDISVREIGSVNQGTITGATWASEDQCVSGKCLSFDGTDDYVNMGNPGGLDFGDSGSFSTSAWFKATATNKFIFGRGNSSDGWWWQFNSSGALIFKILDSENTNESSYITSTTFNDNYWHHIASTIDYESNSISIYVDGIFVGSTNLGGVTNIDTSLGLAIGQRNVAGGLYFSGLIDEPKIFPYALTEDQNQDRVQPRRSGGHGHRPHRCAASGRHLERLSRGPLGL